MDRLEAFYPARRVPEELAAEIRQCRDVIGDWRKLQSETLDPPTEDQLWRIVRVWRFVVPDKLRWVRRKRGSADDDAGALVELRPSVLAEVIREQQGVAEQWVRYLVGLAYPGMQDTSPTIDAIYKGDPTAVAIVVANLRRQYPTPAPAEAPGAAVDSPASAAKTGPAKPKPPGKFGSLADAQEKYGIVSTILAMALEGAVFEDPGPSKLARMCTEYLRRQGQIEPDVKVDKRRISELRNVHIVSQGSACMPVIDAILAEAKRARIDRGEVLPLPEPPAEPAPPTGIDRITSNHIQCACSDNGKRCASPGTRRFGESDRFYCERHYQELSGFVSEQEEDMRSQPRRRPSATTKSDRLGAWRKSRRLADEDPDGVEN